MWVTTTDLGGIAWRAADSLALRDCLGVGLDQEPPDHSTMSRTRRLIALETHRAVFTWILQRLSTAGLVKGKTIAAFDESAAAVGASAVDHRDHDRKSCLRAASMR